MIILDEERGFKCEIQIKFMCLCLCQGGRAFIFGFIDQKHKSVFAFTIGLQIPPGKVEITGFQQGSRK